ncbi:MAG: glycine/D-amino acid oxidase-like deaminating enzyme, partial [Oceanospirillaceae bacterium]
NTANHKIKAQKIILAVNGHIESFGFLKRRLLHVFTYASMSEALNKEQLRSLGGSTDWGVLPADPMGTTVRKISDYQGSGDRITVRNHFTFNPSLQISQQEIAAIVKKHDKSFAARFPMLSDVSMQYRWGGRLCLSLNSVPAFGELETGIYAAACQNGLGTVKGTLSGKLAAELAVLGPTEEVAEYLSFEQPKKLPPQPFLSLGVNANLAYKQWLAGKEV